jgi:hypothetical protein
MLALGITPQPIRRLSSPLLSLRKQAFTKMTQIKSPALLGNPHLRVPATPRYPRPRKRAHCGHRDWNWVDNPLFPFSIPRPASRLHPLLIVLNHSCILQDMACLPLPLPPRLSSTRRLRYNRRPIPTA